MNIATCEAEVSALNVSLVEQRRVAERAEDKVATQSMEIQQLHAALAEVRREVRKSTNGNGELIGRGRLPPMDEASTPEQLKKRIRELEQELTAERVDMSAVRLELK